MLKSDYTHGYARYSFVCACGYQIMNAGNPMWTAPLSWAVECYRRSGWDIQTGAGGYARCPSCVAAVAADAVQSSSNSKVD